MSKNSIRKEIQRATREIDNAVKDGVEGTAYHDGILDEAIEAGQKRIRRKDRVWHKQVLHGFKKETSGEYSGVYQIVNRARYSEVVDEGVAPAGKHGPFKSPPPPENLLPWVQDHMYVFSDYTDPRDAAEALSESLYERGIEGIFFTKSMIRYLENEAEYDLERYVNRRLEARL